MFSLEGLYRSISISLASGDIYIGKVHMNIYEDLMVIIKIILIIALMKVIIRIANYTIDKIIKKHNESRFSNDAKRSKTIGALLKSIIRYTVYFFGIMIIINLVFGKDIGNISITFASIGGVAIGFAGQNIVKDIINGYFILLENQYAVGEYVSIDNKDGIVESLELRVTKIRDFNGDLHIIPNSLITKVTNHSRGAIRISVDVNIAYEESIDRAIKVIESVCENFAIENDDIIEAPKVLGVTNFGANGTTIKVNGKVKPMTQWTNENELKRQIKVKLDEEDIMIPGSKIEIIKGVK